MKSEVEELKRVFEENVSSHWVPWGRAFDNFLDYAVQLKKSKLTDRFVSHELSRCTTLLVVKKIDPKGIASSFTLRDNVQK
jgi:hypothetical protein